MTATIAPAESATDSYRSTLKAAGHSTTRNREMLLATLDAHGRPVTIPQILALEPRLAQSSVYRNLRILTDTGIARIVPTVLGDHTYFELACDARTWRSYAHCARCLTMHRLKLRIDVSIAEHTVVDGVTTLVVRSCASCPPEVAS